MSLTELLNPAVLFAVGVAVAFPAIVVLGVAVLRRVISRRNPDLGYVADPEPPRTIPDADAV